MAADDNVVKIPDRLERRAQKIEAAIARRTKGDAEWVVGTVELAIELAGARADHGYDDRKFGAWLDARIYGNSAIDPHERAILIRWGKNPNETRAMLENTKSRSIRVIDRVFTGVGKSSSSRSSERDPLPKTDAVRESLRTTVEAGKPIDRRKWAKQLGVSEGTIQRAEMQERARLEGLKEGAKGTIQFTKAQDHDVEMRVKALNRKRENEFEARVTAETKKRIDSLFPGLEKLRDDAKRNEKYYRDQIAKIAIFTEAEYRDILLCTHEANPSAETRQRAFIALNARKNQLTGKL
jgi:hypothetical protein